MIKRANKDDYDRVVQCLNQEASINTTLLAYIERYGFEKDFQDIWLYTNNKESQGVLIRHFNSLYIYNQGSIDVEELATFISFVGTDIVLGRLDVLSDVSTYLKDMFIEPSVHMSLKNKTMIMSSSQVHRAELVDCDEMAQLIYNVPEFSRFYHSPQEIVKGMRRKIEMGKCRYFVLKVDGKIVSQAYTTIESSRYATISGVVTLEEYCKQGLASMVVSGICQDILKDNKVPNLFYSNIEAGRVYKKLGFVFEGDYAMLLDYKYKL